MFRNQPFARDCTGDDSGVGESEGKDVNDFVSSAGEGACPREVLETFFEGLTRVVPFFLGFDAVELWLAVRTRSTALGVSTTAISFQMGMLPGRQHLIKCVVSETRGSGSLLGGKRVGSLIYCFRWNGAHVGQASCVMYNRQGSDGDDLYSVHRLTFVCTSESVVSEEEAEVSSKQEAQ
jgi:hypothetical protein